MARYGLMDAPFLAISNDNMRPRLPAFTESHDFFRNRRKNRLDPRHELVRLAGILDWQRFDETFSALYCPDQSGPGSRPTRRMVGLEESLQHVYRRSDEAVVAHWAGNFYGQSS